MHGDDESIISIAIEHINKKKNKKMFELLVSTM